MAHVGYNVKDAQHHLIACFHPPPIRKIERNILQRLHNRCADNKKEENEKEGLKEGKGNQRTAECNDDRSQHSKRIDAFYCYLQVCNLNRFLILLNLCWVGLDLQNLLALCTAFFIPALMGFYIFFTEGLIISADHLSISAWFLSPCDLHVFINLLFVFLGN